MVVEDDHQPLATGLGGYTETDWVDTWKALASRYASKTNVIGADLKNEPHGEATWGTGAANDWRRAAELAGNAVLANAPNWLVFVEGIEGAVAGGQQLDRHWWGGNLEGVRNNPVRLNVANRLVYSPHEYGPGVFAQPWFSSPNVESILADRWEKGFGYIHDGGTAPILIGEFGAKNVGPDTVEGRWIRQFADYLAEKGISWTFWAWNPNSGDTGGVLQDDWKTINSAKMGLLSGLMARKSPAYEPGSGSGAARGTTTPPAQTPASGQRPTAPRVLWSANRRSNRVTAIIKPVSGVPYTLTAARGKAQRSGSCQAVTLKGKKLVRCEVTLSDGGWKVSALPTKAGVSGAASAKRFRL